MNRTTVPPRRLLLAGLASLATVIVHLPISANAGSGTWSANASANWSDSTRWVGGNVADGAGETGSITADITSGRGVAIDGTSRTLGILNIGDLNATHVFTISGTGGVTLTFDNGASNAQLNAISTSFGDI